MVNKTDTFPELALAFVRRILPLSRFDLFLQGTLFIIIFFDSFLYQLLRRSSAEGLLSNNVHNWVFMGVGAAEVLFGSFIGWLGTRKKNLGLAAWLAASGICGLLVLSMPQPTSVTSDIGLCHAQDSDDLTVTKWVTEENNDSWIRTTLIIANITLNAFSRIAVYALGVTYLDSHDPSNGALYLGVQVSIRVSVSISSEKWMRAPAFGQHWFRAQVSMSSLMIMFSILFSLFPKIISGYKVPAIPADNMGYLETLKRILSNKTVVIQTIALSLLNMALWGFIKNEQSYVKVLYYVPTIQDDGWTSRASVDLLRTLVILYCIGIFRVRFSGRRSNGVKATTAAKAGGYFAILVGIFFLVLTFLRCKTSPLVGLEDAGYTQPECSAACGCDSQSQVFAPVCNIDDRFTYISPCHAGCGSVENLNGILMFRNCTCGSGRFVSTGCDVSNCDGIFSIYQLFYVNALALTGASLLMQSMVILRAVASHDQPTAMGTYFSVVALIAYIPGHYLFMFINEATCGWMEDGVCLVHKESLAPVLAGVTAGLMITSGILSMVANKVQRKSALL